MPLKRLAIPIALAVAAGLAGLLILTGFEQEPGPGVDRATLADVVPPRTLSARARLGQQAFEANCAVCHGPNAAGQKGLGPPLVHSIYEPSHHADEAFQRAVAIGVMAHHWPFGNMPRVEGLDRREVSLIVTYIRELQRANGIH